MTVKVGINEFTTMASVWSQNQFLGATAVKGFALDLRIAGQCAQLR